MSDVFFASSGCRAPDHHLGVGSGTHAAQTARVMVAFEPVRRRDRRRTRVVVVGDVNSTLACALVGRQGRRSASPTSRPACAAATGRCPRRSTASSPTASATCCFAPSPDAVDNLRAEGYRDDQIHFVGNVMIDTLLGNLDAAARTDVADAARPRPAGRTAS